MKITYLFLIYKNPEIVFHTCKRLSGNGIRFLVHVDKNSNTDFSILYNVEGLEFADVRFATAWGSSGLVKATAHCLEYISANYDTDYVVLMSESDYPVKSADYISSYLQKSKKDFATANLLPCDHPLDNKNCYWMEGGMRRVNTYALYLNKKSIVSIEPKTVNWGNMRQFGKLMLNAPTKLPAALKLLFKSKRKPIEGFPWCGGDQWFILRKETIDKIVNSILSNPLILEEADNTFIPDEVTISTLIHALSPANERENITLRYIHWPSPKAKSPGAIQVGDTNLISELVENKDLLFARKIEDIEVAKYIDSLL